MSSRIACSLVLAASLAAAPARADIEGDTLVDTQRGLRLELPRGWRASEISAYPGVVVRLARSTPRVTIVVTVDPVVGPCADPIRFCSDDAGAAINVLAAQLKLAGFEITAQAQSRTPELEYKTGARFLRHAVLVVDDQVVSVILAADTPATRAGQSRAFERLVQSIRPSTPPAHRPPAPDDRELAPP